MVDLDYQRSLSMLLLGSTERKVLHRAGYTVQHFLSGESHSAKDLLERKKDLSQGLPNCSVLTNSDSRSGEQGADGLEETETRLMVEWLFDRHRPDPRFFLREALHDRAVGDAFRYVFLDCPPRLTTACVNALAASDYVLIPVVPDAVSIRAAENLLTTLQTLRQVVCPDLRVLAVVPNMVKFHSGKPTIAHANALGTLRQPLRERWHEPIHVAESCIRYDSGFGLAAAELDVGEALSLAISDGAVAACFQRLAKELLQEMRHHESRRASAVPA
jgi:cellulose biosynthesis protein BcsQ